MRLGTWIAGVITLLALGVGPVVLVSVAPRTAPLLLVQFFGFTCSWALVAILLALSGVASLAGNEEPGAARGRKWFGPLLAAFVAIPLVLIGSIGLSRVLPHPLPEGWNARKFDAVAWASAGADEPDESSAKSASVRQEMLGDLVGNVLPGKTKVEIEAILGPDAAAGAWPGSGAALAFRTGPEPDVLFGTVDYEWLLIYVDDHGRYSRYALRGD